MDRYRRAYRDGNSPLTPLTPLSTNAFDFNIDTESSSSSCPRFTSIFDGVRKSPIPRERQRLNSVSACPWSTIPKSSDSARNMKSNNYIKQISMLGSERTLTSTSTSISTPTSTPIVPLRPTRHKRPIKREIPEIRLQPPPRSKRCRNQDWQNCNIPIKSEPRDFDEDLENGHCLAPRRSFDSKNIRLSSPVQPKPLSPRFGEFLARWGINCLKSIFERQEVDLQTFCCLTADDLELLGIQDPVNRERVIHAINFLGGCQSDSGHRLGIE